MKKLKEQGSYCVVAGPTASGKSELGMRLARALDGEIVSCDSVQVYRGFDIGSAKPSLQEQAEVAHHLIDIVDATQVFDASDYAKLARQAIQGIRARGKLPIVVGGTGFYLRALWGQLWDPNLPSDPKVREQFVAMSKEDLFALLKEKDPKRAQEIHPNDHFRLARAMELVTLIGGPLAQAGFGNTPKGGDDDAVVIVLSPERAALHQRINERTDLMLKQGFIDEVNQLLTSGIPVNSKPMQSIGYREVAAYLSGSVPKSELAPRIKASTRQYAKRQTTWFRSVEASLRLKVPDIESVLRELS